MIISDVLYGEFEVDKVIGELILCKPVQRLKGIHQGGASYLVNEKWNVTRFEHSLGVMLLIKKLGGSVEEQIAGLLHHVSHTAFSHVVDYVLVHHEEDYHEKIYSSIIKNSDIPMILSKYGYNYEELLLDISKWTLLEVPAPELCADRIDYTLRDMYVYGHISLEEIQCFLDNLLVIDGKIFLKTVEIAEWFVETYYKEVIDFFMDPLNIYGNEMLTKILRLSLDKNIISLNDFLREDDDLVNKIKSAHDNELILLLEKLNQNVRVIEDKENYDLHRKNKVRLVNPSILKNNELIPASKLSKSVKKMMDTAYEKAIEGKYIKVISK